MVHLAPTAGGWLGWSLASARLEAAMETLLIVLGAVLLLLIVGGGALIAPRARRRGRAVPSSQAPSEVGTTTAAPLATQAPEAGAAAPPAEVTGLPPVTEPPAAPAPAVEKPPPSAGRMVRLRSRLARSQSAFGSALLSLLSSGKLDDQTWDEIEEILITADMAPPRPHIWSSACAPRSR